MFRFSQKVLLGVLSLSLVWGVFLGIGSEVIAQGANALNGVPTGSLTVTPYEDQLSSVQGNVSARDTIIKYTNFLLSFLGILCVTMVTFAGLQYIISFGDDGTMEKARKLILYNVIGILIILIAFALVNTVIKGAASGDDDRNGPTGPDSFIGTTPGNGGVSGGNGFAGTLDPGSAGSDTGRNFLAVNGLVITGDGINDYGNGYSVSRQVASLGLAFSFANPAECVIDFGDGTKGALDTITNRSDQIIHAYGQTGTYKIQADCREADGVRRQYVKILVIDPVTAIGTVSTSEAMVNQPVMLSGQRSTTKVGTLTQFVWTCEGGEGCFAPIENSEAEVSFAKPGDYILNLLVRNNLTDVGTSQIKIKVLNDKPTAEFVIAETGVGGNPGRVTLNAEESTTIDGRNDNLVYVWNLDGKTIRRGTPELDYAFSNPGIQEIGLIVVQRLRGQEVFSDPVYFTHEVASTLAVDFVLPKDVIMGQALTLRGKSEKATTFVWSFPEGATQQAEVIRYVFKKSGVFPVTLTVKNRNTGETNTVTKEIFVRNEGRPTALMEIKVGDDLHLLPGTSYPRGSQVQVKSLSVDKDGGGAGMTETWLVNGVPVSPENINSMFESVGNYEIKLVSADIDNANKRDEVRTTLRIVNQKPEISFLQVDPNEDYTQVKVVAQAQDKDGEIMQYRFEVLQNGLVRDAQVAVSNQVYFNLAQYGSDRTYNFRVQVQDNDRGTQVYTSDESLNVTIATDNTVPQSAIHVTPGVIGDTRTNFTFYAEGTDLDEDALVYEWVFPPYIRRFGSTVSYRFLEAGSHEVELRVSDGIETVEKVVQINVKEPENPVVETVNRPPNLKIKGVLPAAVVPVGTKLSFYSEATDPDRDVLTYEWDMADGARLTVPHVAYVYNTPGKRTVTLTVSDGINVKTESIEIDVLESSAEVLALKKDITVLEQDLSDMMNNSVDGGNSTEEIMSKRRELAQQRLRLDFLQPQIPVKDQALAQEAISMRSSAPKPLSREMIRVSSSRQVVEQTIESDINRLQNLQIEANTDIERQALQREIRYLKGELNKIQNPSSQAMSQAFYREAIRDMQQYILQVDNDKKERYKSQLESLEVEVRKASGGSRLMSPTEFITLQKEQNVDFGLRLEQAYARVKDDVFTYVKAQGTVQTTFFLYGSAPFDYPAALNFTWKLGDGRFVSGQNAVVRYDAPGEYQVEFVVTDGETTVSDFVTIVIRDSFLK